MKFPVAHHKSKFFFFFLFNLIILLLSLVSATSSITGNFLYDNPSLPHLNPTSNQSLVTVNNTIYWQGYTPITLPHNILSGLQGGQAGEYYHLNQSLFDRLVSYAFSWITRENVAFTNESNTWTGLQIFLTNITFGENVNIAGDLVVNGTITGTINVTVSVSNYSSYSNNSDFLNGYNSTTLPHNQLAGLQGGNITSQEYYHLSSIEYTSVLNQTNYTLDNYVPYIGAIKNLNMTGFNISASNLFIPIGGSMNWDTNVTVNGTIAYMVYNLSRQRLEMWVNGKLQQDWGNSTTIYGTATFEADAYFKNMSGEGLFINTNVLVDGYITANGNISGPNIFAGNICYSDGTNCSYINTSIGNLTNMILSINQTLTYQIANLSDRMDILNASIISVNNSLTLVNSSLTNHIENVNLSLYNQIIALNVSQYNDTILILNINGSLYNYTFNVNQSLYDYIQNLNVSQYNNTILILEVNSSLYNLTLFINSSIWDNFANYYNKSESDARYILNGSQIPANFVNKTTGTFFLNQLLDIIIDALQTSINDLWTYKLNVTDQRYNDTSLVNQVNGSLYNYTFNVNESLYNQIIALNISQYNDTILILDINGSLYNYTFNVNESLYNQILGLNISQYNDTVLIYDVNGSLYNYTFNVNESLYNQIIGLNVSQYNDTTLIYMVNESLYNYTFNVNQTLYDYIQNLNVSQYNDTLLVLNINQSLWDNFANYYNKSESDARYILNGSQIPTNMVNKTTGTSFLNQLLDAIIDALEIEIGTLQTVKLNVTIFDTYVNNTNITFINIQNNITDLYANKLNITDQRYNDTLLILNVNGSLYNYTYEVNNTLYNQIIALNVTQYNDTLLILTVNGSLYNYTTIVNDSLFNYTYEVNNTLYNQIIALNVSQYNDTILILEINGSLYNYTFDVNQSLDNNKLDKTDQRYNDTALINQVNGSLYNYTFNVNESLYNQIIALNLSQYNDTILILNINGSLYNYTYEVNSTLYNQILGLNVSQYNDTMLILNVNGSLYNYTFNVNQTLYDYIQSLNVSQYNDTVLILNVNQSLWNNFVNYYNKTESDARYILNGSQIPANSINKTTGTSFLNELLDVIIDSLQSSIDSLWTNKLNVTDQRYNDTTLINTINGTLYNYTYEVNNTLYNQITALNVSQYNDTILILGINGTLYNYTYNVNESLYNQILGLNVSQYNDTVLIYEINGSLYNYTFNVNQSLYNQIIGLNVSQYNDTTLIYNINGSLYNYTFNVNETLYNYITSINVSQYNDTLLVLNVNQSLWNNFANYYNKSESDVRYILNGSQIPTNLVNKTTGTFFLNELLDVIIDSLQGSIDSLWTNKLNVTDQRYNDTILIGTVNESLYNYTTIVNSSLYNQIIALNVSQYNDTVLIYEVNGSLYNYTFNVNDTLYNQIINLNVSQYNDTILILNVNGSLYNYTFNVNQSLYNYIRGLNVSQYNDTILILNVNQSLWDNFINYYDKSEVYNKTEIDNINSSLYNYTTLVNGSLYNYTFDVNKTLSDRIDNVSTTNFYSKYENVTPPSNMTYALGNSTNWWDVIWVGTINSASMIIGTINATSATIGTLTVTILNAESVNATNVTANNIVAGNLSGVLDWSNLSNVPYYLNATSGIYLYDINGTVYLNETKLNSTIRDLAEVRAYQMDINLTVSSGTGGAISTNLINFLITEIIVTPPTNTSSYRFQATTGSSSIIDKDRMAHVGTWDIAKSYSINDTVIANITNANTDGTYAVKIKYIDNFYP